MRQSWNYPDREEDSIKQQKIMIANTVKST